MTKVQNGQTFPAVYALSAKMKSGSKGRFRLECPAVRVLYRYNASKHKASLQTRFPYRCSPASAFFTASICSSTALLLVPPFALLISTLA